MRANSRERQQQGMTLLEVLVVLVILGLALSIVVPSLMPARRGAHRTACAANLGSFARASLMYAEANRGCLPSMSVTLGPFDTSLHARNLAFVGACREFGGVDPGRMQVASNTRGPYRLLLGKAKAYLKPKNFVCPTAVNRVKHDRNGTSLYAPDDVDRQRPFHDFDGTKRAMNDSEMTEFSYSFQVNVQTNVGTQDKPDIRGASLRNTQDPGLAIAADRNPYSNHVAIVEGLAVYQWIPNKPGMVSPPAGTGFTLKALRTRAANSRNHGGEGQYVSFLDGHVKWFSHPLAGVDEDFLWGPVDPAKGFGPAEPGQGMNYGLTRPHTGPGPNGRTVWQTDTLLLP